MSASISHVPLLYCYQWFLFIPVTNRLHRQRLRRERVQATLPETQPRIGVNLVVSVSISLSRLYSRFGSICTIVHHASSRFVSFNCSTVACVGPVFKWCFLCFMVFNSVLSYSLVYGLSWLRLFVGIFSGCFHPRSCFQVRSKRLCCGHVFQQAMDCFCMLCGYVVFTTCFKNVLSCSFIMALSPSLKHVCIVFWSIVI